MSIEKCVIEVDLLAAAGYTLKVNMVDRNTPAKPVTLAQFVDFEVME